MLLEEYVQVQSGHNCTINFLSFRPSIGPQYHMTYLARNMVKNFPEFIQQSLGISQRLFYILSAVPRSCPIAFKSISKQLLTNTKQFLSCFLEGAFSHLLIQENLRQRKLFNSLSGSSNITDLSNIFTLSLSQSHATVPLIASLSKNSVCGELLGTRLK